MFSVAPPMCTFVSPHNYRCTRNNGDPTTGRQIERKPHQIHRESTKGRRPSAVAVPLLYRQPTLFRHCSTVELSGRREGFKEASSRATCANIGLSSVPEDGSCEILSQ